VILSAALQFSSKLSPIQDFDTLEFAPMRYGRSPKLTKQSANANARLRQLAACGVTSGQFT
jgi:hypothetical protein